LRDRRGAGAAAAALDVNAGGAAQAAGVTPADAGDKPRLRKPATLFVR
jgi:hypothetical protein